MKCLGKHGIILENWKKQQKWNRQMWKCEKEKRKSDSEKKTNLGINLVWKEFFQLSFHNIAHSLHFAVLSRKKICYIEKCSPCSMLNTHTWCWANEFQNGWDGFFFVSFSLKKTKCLELCYDHHHNCHSFSLHVWANAQNQRLKDNEKI